MEYLGHKITIEAVTGRSVYGVNDKGEITEVIDVIDTSIAPDYWGIEKDGEYIDWLDYSEYTFEQIKDRIKNKYSKETK